MRKGKLSEDTESIWAFTPLFTTAVIFAALIRIFDLFLFITSTDMGYALFWLEPVIGVLSFGDLFLLMALLFFGLSIYELIGKLRSIRNWITMLTCLLLVTQIVVICLNVRSWA